MSIVNRIITPLSPVWASKEAAVTLILCEQNAGLNSDKRPETTTVIAPVVILVFLDEFSCSVSHSYNWTIATYTDI